MMIRFWSVFMIDSDFNQKLWKNSKSFVKKIE